MTINGGVRWDRYKGWLPKQTSLAATVGPVVVASKTFAETDLYTWNQIAPRIGVVFDLAGNGKTVIKGNYGLYWHNPGAGTGAGANPNISEKFAQYGWNDANGDKRWQPGEETTLSTAQLAGAVKLDPTLSDPYTHEVSAWLEHQVTDTLGARVGFVYKTEDDLVAQYNPYRPISSYTVSVSPAAGAVSYPLSRSTTGAAITGLTNGQAYTFTVTRTGDTSGSSSATWAVLGMTTLGWVTPRVSRASSR